MTMMLLMSIIQFLLYWTWLSSKMLMNWTTEMLRDVIVT